MKGYYEEHLEAVAERNRELFETRENDFKNYMFSIGWQNNEIEQMIKYLNRKGAK